MLYIDVVLATMDTPKCTVMPPPAPEEVPTCSTPIHDLKAVVYMLVPSDGTNMRFVQCLTVGFQATLCLHNIPNV